MRSSAGQASNASDPTRLNYIDGLRALAVLSVIVVHVFAGIATAGGHLAGFPYNCGARGVDLFFVISGFCLSYPYIEGLARGRGSRIDYGRFVARRLSRIAPPYYIAVAVFSVLALTPFAFPTTWATSQQMRPAFWHELVPNFFFLPTREPVINSSFWTLGVEMRWYLICPFLIALSLRSRVGFGCVFVGLCALYQGTGRTILELGTLPTFMLGIVAAHLIHVRSRVSAYAPFVFSIAFPLALLHQSTAGEIDHGDPLWQLVFASLVILAADPRIARLFAVAPLRAIGFASYSIYLVHQPIIDWLGQQGIAWPLAGCISLLAGFAFWYFVERPLVAPPVRRRIEERLSKLFGRLRRPAIVISLAARPVHDAA